MQCKHQWHERLNHFNSTTVLKIELIIPYNVTKKAKRESTVFGKVSLRREITEL